MYLRHYGSGALSMQRAASTLAKLRKGRLGKVWGFYVVLGATMEVVPIALYAHDARDFPFSKTFLAIQLILVCLYPTFRYIAKREHYPPIFPLTCLSYAYQFGVPIFTRYPRIEVLEGTTVLSDGDVTAALGLSLLGACTLIIGYYASGTALIRTNIPQIRLPLLKKRAFIHCVIVVSLSPLLSSVGPSVQEQFPQAQSIINLLNNQLLVAIGIMSWLIYSTSKPQFLHKAFLCLLVALQLFIGISSTVLELPLVGICIVLIFKWTYTQRIPVALIIVIMTVVFFLQPVKVEVREENWYGSEAQSGSSIGKATLWIGRATDFWLQTLNGERTISDSTSNTLSRSDFIHQFAYIHSLTPSVIPYQYGATYSFFQVSFIPRVLWPDKPVAKANKFFGVTYRITSEAGAERSNFGVSLVGESFINFGIAGVIVIMMFQGAILKVIELMFAGPNSGAGGQAVLLSCSIWFLNGVGSSAEILFGGILQNLVVGCALLIWARAPRPVQRRSGRKNAAVNNSTVLSAEPPRLE